MAFFPVEFRNVGNFWIEASAGRDLDVGLTPYFDNFWIGQLINHHEWNLWFDEPPPLTIGFRDAAPGIYHFVLSGTIDGDTFSAPVAVRITPDAVTYWRLPEPTPTPTPSPHIRSITITGQQQHGINTSDGRTFWGSATFTVRSENVPNGVYNIVSHTLPEPFYVSQVSISNNMGTFRVYFDPAPAGRFDFTISVDVAGEHLRASTTLVLER